MSPSRSEAGFETKTNLVNPMNHKTKYIWSTDLIDAMLDHMNDSEIASAIDCEIADNTVVDPQRWYAVNWPEHVTTPRCNSDALYSPTDDDTVRAADWESLYGGRETSRRWHDLQPEPAE